MTARPAMRSAVITARVGIWLGVCVLGCFATGLISHFIQHPQPWFWWPTRPVWLYRATQGAHVILGIAAGILTTVRATRTVSQVQKSEAALTDATEQIIAAAHRLLPRLRPGVRYARASLALTGLTPAGATPGLHAHEVTSASTVVDAVQARFGRAAIGYGRSGIKRPASWMMHRRMLSPRYTTCWDEIPTAT